MTPDKTFFDKRYSRKEHKFRFRYDKEILSDILKYKNSGKVLDLGCGEGGMALALAEQGFDVTCLDISNIAIETLKKEASKRNLEIQTICEDLENFQINKDYDVVLMLGILQFLGDKGEEFLKEIKEHTISGGINVIDAFVNKWLPREKLKEFYFDWEALEFEEYKTKTIKDGVWDMNYWVFSKF
jgi:tellurite methyltransferase